MDSKSKSEVIKIAVWVLAFYAWAGLTLITVWHTAKVSFAIAGIFAVLWLLVWFSLTEAVRID